MIQKQSDIDRKLSIIKKWYQTHYSLCLFCGHAVRKEGDLAHLIRKSYSRELQTVKLNTGLAHRDCHEIYDNDYSGAVYLPRIVECLYIIYLLDENYFNLIAGNFVTIFDVLQLFPGVEYREIKHHGELIQLTYLYS
jgi:hypothetical protein